MARRKAKQSVHHVEITAGSNHTATAAVDYSALPAHARKRGRRSQNAVQRMLNAI